MADKEPPRGDSPPQGDAPQGALPWLRRSQIVNFGTRYAFPPVSENQDAWLREYLSGIESFDKEIHVLDLLQRTRTTDINPSALQILLNALVDALPREVQDRVGLHMGGPDKDHGDSGPAIGSLDWFSQDPADFNRTIDLIRCGIIPPPFSNNREFILWVVNAGVGDFQHYVTIILHYEASDPFHPDIRDRVSHWSIVDPLDIKKIPPETEQRLAQLLQEHYIENAIQCQLWVPPPDNGGSFASGLVAYSVVSQLLDRIGIMQCSGKQFDPEEFFAPTRPWFNPDAVRAEALGRAGMKAMEKFRWKARLGLFPLQGTINDGKREGVPVTELGPRIEPPRAHELPLKPYLTLGEERSLFGEQDAATQTPRQLPGGEQQIGQGAVLSSGQLSPSSFSSSSYSSFSEIDEDQDPEAFYYRFKLQERNEAKEEERLADDACSDALKFARRVQHEVLESPDENNIPTAYAVDRLFMLVRRAIERSRAANAAISRIGRRSAGVDAHRMAMNRLVEDLMWRDFQRGAQSRTDAYTEADRVLQAAYHARGGDLEEDQELAEVWDAGTARDYGSADYYDDSEDSGEDEDEDTDHVYSRSAGAPRGVKRGFDFETSEKVDEDGEQVYTLHVNKRRKALVEEPVTRRLRARARRR
ncbi:hypothetical protein F4825DRAFT_462770 [Nemania diffusa]|nr:hypothetical protein F4825DRAFT_462770 [Nemania diffusa]